MLDPKRAYKNSKALGRSSEKVVVSHIEVGYRKRSRMFDLAEPFVYAKADVQGSKGVQYHVELVWLVPAGGDKRIKSLRGETFRVGPLMVADGCRWHCPCEDFHHTFQWYLWENGGALYEPEPVEVKGTGAPRAVNEPGMCKHVMAVMDNLRSQGFIH